MDRNQAYGVNEGQVAHNDFGDEVVVIHFATGNYYSLRGTAALLWKHLSQAPASPAALLTLFADPPDDAVDSIASFLADMCARSMVVESAGGEQAIDANAGAESRHAFEVPQMEAFEDLQALLVADVIHDTDDQGWPHIAVDPAA